jgi:hypothetical protein
MAALDVLIPVASELVSATLALIVVVSLIRLFRVTRRGYLFGLPIGFSFLTVGYVIFTFSYMLTELVHPLTLLALVCQCYGFVFVAVTYFLKKRWGRIGKWFFSAIIVLAVAVTTTIIMNASFVPPYHAYAGAFRVTNVILLGYILSDLFRGVRSERRGIGPFVLASYALLGLSQYSYLIWSRDNGFLSFLLGHLMEIIGLAILAIVLLQETLGNR